MCHPSVHTRDWSLSPLPEGRRRATSWTGGRFITGLSGLYVHVVLLHDAKQKICVFLFFFQSFFTLVLIYLFCSVYKKEKNAASSSKRTGAKCSNLLLLLSLIFFATI